MQESNAVESTGAPVLTRLVLSWATLYTRGLPAPVRQERLTELESDLWEQSQTARARTAAGIGTTLHVLLRLALGIPFDIAWRLETGGAIRSGKEPNMNRKWTPQRWFDLLVMLTLLPLPRSWLQQLGRRLTPAREESSLSILMLALGAQVAVLPIGFGLLAVFWEAPAFPLEALGIGTGQLVAGTVAFLGLYVARSQLTPALLLIGFSALAMGLIAPWALPGVVVGGGAMLVCAVVRSMAPPPAALVLLATE